MTSEFDPKGRPCVVFEESKMGVSENVIYQGEAVGFLDDHLGIQGNSLKENSTTAIEWFPKAWIISGRIKFCYGLNNSYLKSPNGYTMANPKRASPNNLIENNSQNVDLVPPKNITQAYHDRHGIAKKEPAKLETSEEREVGGEYRPSASASTMLKIGEEIPEFQLYSTDGSLFSTSKIAKKTILYFYPADGTESCTIEAKGFSAVYSSIIEMGLDIIGVSPDTLEAHSKFRYDQHIPFHLLFDEESKVCESFGLLQSPPPYEKIPVRITFLIDVDRKILGVWNDIDVSTHSDDVVSFVLEVLHRAG